MRATHLLTNAAWFGGSLMGAVALNPAARQGDDQREQSAILDEGWKRWGPVQGAAIGLHLLSGIAIVADNRRRVAVHPPTTAGVVLKTGLTALAVAASAAAYTVGADLGDAKADADHDADARRRADRLASRIRVLQWATPAATAGLLVLDAYLGEQQRGAAGLLDRASRGLRRR